MSNYTYFIEHRCPECGDLHERPIALIEALQDDSIPFDSEDIKDGILAIRKELKLATADYRRLCAISPKNVLAYTKQYEDVKDQIESKAGKLLKLR